MSTTLDTPSEATLATEQTSSQSAALRLFTVAEYYKIAAAGILRPEERVELIEGRILTMSPKGIMHAACNDKASEYLSKVLGNRVIVRNQNPVNLGDDTEPEPDLVLVAPQDRRYFDHHPIASEILLILEIADSSLEYDRHMKSLLYAKAGIMQYCLLSLQSRELEDYRDPSADGYRSKQTYRSDQSFNLVGFTDMAIPVSELLPPE